MRTRQLPRGVAFAGAAFVLGLFLAASAAPTPLYVVYQEQWRFSELTLTGVFAIYVVGLLGSLLVLGSLSDHVGRRPVLAAAVALETVALVLFLVAGGIEVLAAARFVQGVATGAAMTVLGAYLVDLDPPHAPGRASVVNTVTPTAALALGALGTGALVEYAPAPTHLVFAVLLGGVLLAALVVAFAPETSARRPGARASLRPRVGVPPQLRAEFAGVVPALLAAWSLVGLYLSLGPSVAAGELGLRNHLVGGLLVALLCGTGAASAFLLRGHSPDRLLALSAGTLAVGMTVTLTGVETGEPLLAVVGTLIAGIGFGPGMLGVFGRLMPRTAAHERGAVLAVTLVVAYLAFSLPALAAGLAATTWGLGGTVLVYGLVVIGLGVAALGGQWALARRTVVAAG